MESQEMEGDTDEAVLIYRSAFNQLFLSYQSAIF